MSPWNATMGQLAKSHQIIFTYQSNIASRRLPNRRVRWRTRTRKRPWAGAIDRRWRTFGKCFGRDAPTFRRNIRPSTEILIYSLKIKPTHLQISVAHANARIVHGLGKVRESSVRATFKQRCAALEGAAADIQRNDFLFHAHYGKNKFNLTRYQKGQFKGKVKLDPENLNIHVFKSLLQMRGFERQKTSPNSVKVFWRQRKGFVMRFIITHTPKWNEWSQIQVANGLMGAAKSWLNNKFFPSLKALQAHFFMELWQ